MVTAKINLYNGLLQFIEEKFQRAWDTDQNLLLAINEVNRPLTEFDLLEE